MYAIFVPVFIAGHMFVLFFGSDERSKSNTARGMAFNKVAYLF